MGLLTQKNAQERLVFISQELFKIKIFFLGQLKWYQKDNIEAEVRAAINYFIEKKAFKEPIKTDNLLVYPHLEGTWKTDPKLKHKGTPLTIHPNIYHLHVQSLKDFKAKSSSQNPAAPNILQRLKARTSKTKSPANNKRKAPAQNVETESSFSEYSESSDSSFDETEPRITRSQQSSNSQKATPKGTEPKTTPRKGSSAKKKRLM
eukprot:Sdes_comp19755_c0_seq1m11789